jgi:hypothetical protein
MTKRKGIPDTGDKCTKCGEGRVALVSSILQDGDMDDEPYTNGVKEGDNETITFNGLITFVIYACDHCGHVYAILIE